MLMQNEFSEKPLTKTLSHTYIGRDHKRFTEEEPVLTEHHLHVFVNDTIEMDFVCLPQFLPELILGHLVTTGYITHDVEVESLKVSAAGDTAFVTLKHLHPPKPLCPVPLAEWDPEWIFSLADHFAKGMPVHEQTWATHSCFLSQEGELLFQCEDIGRHNAVDKAIGFALLHRIDRQKCLLYSSGRMPSDMAAKAIRAGIPVMASKGAPTTDAIALAKQYQLTLVCAARKDRMKLYAAPEK